MIAKMWQRWKNIKTVLMQLWWVALLYLMCEVTVTITFERLRPAVAFINTFYSMYKYVFFCTVSYSLNQIFLIKEYRYTTSLPCALK